MQLKAGYGSVHGLPCDEGKSLTWLTCKRAHAGRLDWGLKTSITFVWLSIYQYTDFHFSSPAESPMHEPQLYMAHLYLWCARHWNTSLGYFSQWCIAFLQTVHEAQPPDQHFLMPNHLLCERLISSWPPQSIHPAPIWTQFNPPTQQTEERVIDKGWTFFKQLFFCLCTLSFQNENVFHCINQHWRKKQIEIMQP